VIGRKIVTEDGRYLGKVDDVLIEGEDGRIFGYVLGDHKGKGKHPYLPAEANLKAGKDLIVASESAMRYEWKDQEAGPAAGRWNDPLSLSDEPGIWSRRGADEHYETADAPNRETNPHM
jgi:sporulation protein YlmC with PRC-barrel domain